MKVKRSNLLEAARKASKAIRKSPMESLVCLRIEVTKDKRLLITGTSVNMSIQVFTDTIEANDEFVAIVNSNKFLGLISKMNGEYVSMSMNDLTLTVKCGAAKLTMACIAEDQWTIGKIVTEPEFEIRTSSLAKSIDECAHAVANNAFGDSLISSFKVDFCQDKVRVTALDGHRIAIRDSFELGDEVESTLLLDGECMKEITKLIDGDMLIQTMGEMVKVTGDDIIIHSKMPNGTYFNIESFYNPTIYVSAKVNRMELLDAIEISNMVSSSIIMDMFDDKLALSCKETISEVNTDVAAEVSLTPETNYFRIGFNGKLLIDALRSITDETITLDFINSNSPIYIRNTGYLEIVLPIMIK